MALCGCGPSAKQLADQQARQRFREAVAAMKVCTQGSTYAEFRGKRLALETSYTANQSALADESSQIEELEKVMIATDALWEWQVKFPLEELVSGKRDSSFVNQGWAQDPWEAMLTISPSVAAKAGFTSEQRAKTPISMPRIMFTVV